MRPWGGSSGLPNPAAKAVVAVAVPAAALAAKMLRRDSLFNDTSRFVWKTLTALAAVPCLVWQSATHASDITTQHRETQDL
jgi:hypothetical protein